MINIYLLKFKGEVVYVGRSKNVKKRISQHKSSKEFDEYEVIAGREGSREASLIEDKFIYIYNPKYNNCTNEHGHYVKLEELMRGKKYDTLKLIDTIQRYRIRPIFASNYKPYEIIPALEDCEVE